MRAYQNKIYKRQNKQLNFQAIRKVWIFNLISLNSLIDFNNKNKRKNYITKFIKYLISGFKGWTDKNSMEAMNMELIFVILECFQKYRDWKYCRLWREFWIQEIKNVNLFNGINLWRESANQISNFEIYIINIYRIFI